jgi:hypothetical protein
MKNPEKLATKTTQDEEIQNTNTNNVNKTWALLQTTGGKGLNQPLFLKVSVANSPVCFLSTLSLSKICLLDFGTAQKVWYLFLILLSILLHTITVRKS